MRVAVVGAAARAVRDAAGTEAEVYALPRGAMGQHWALLALLPDAARACESAPRADCLLLPGDSRPTLAAYASQAVGYGFSARDTLTLSGTRLLCLQRSVVTLGGTLIEPQELPLDAALASLPDEPAMLAALLRLLCDI